MKFLFSLLLVLVEIVVGQESERKFLSCPRYSKGAIDSFLFPYYKTALFPPNLNWNEKSQKAIEEKVQKEIMNLCYSIYGFNEFKKVIFSTSFIFPFDATLNYSIVSDIMMEERKILIEKWNRTNEIISKQSYKWNTGFEKFTTWQEVYSFLLPFYYNFDIETNYSEPITIFAKGGFRFLQGLLSRNDITKYFIVEIEGDEGKILAKLIKRNGLNIRPSTFRPFQFMIPYVEYSFYHKYDNTDFVEDERRMNQYLSEFSYKLSEFAKDFEPSDPSSYFPSFLQFGYHLRNQIKGKVHYQHKSQTHHKSKHKNYTHYKKPESRDTDWPVINETNESLPMPLVEELKEYDEVFHYEDLELFHDYYRQRNLPFTHLIITSPNILKIDHKFDNFLIEKNKYIVEKFDQDGIYILSSFFSQFVECLSSYKIDDDKPYYKAIDDSLLINRIFYGVLNDYDTEYIRYILNFLFSSTGIPIEVIDEKDLTEFIEFCRKGLLEIALYIRDLYMMEKNFGSDYFFTAGSKFYLLIRKVYGIFNKYKKK